MSKPGRNDPCPCGSGKKYKACHASEDRAREPAASNGLPSGAQAGMQAALALIQAADVPRIEAALQRTGALLAAWGPGEATRFPEKAFDAHIDQEVPRVSSLAETNAEEARASLMRSTLGALGSKKLLESLQAAFLERALTDELPAEERQALYVAALLASASRKGARFRPEEAPLLEVLFDVQFREWCVRHAELATKLERIAEQLEVARAQRTQEQAMDALLAQAESDAEVADRIAAEAKERAARVETALRLPETPAVFTPDEELWLSCVLWAPLNAVKDAGADPAGRRAAVTQLIRQVKGALDPEFLAELLTRMRLLARTELLPAAIRGFWLDASVAFEAEPARMVMAVLFTARREAEARTPEEAELVRVLKDRKAWTVEDMEPYRAWLETAQWDVAMERIRRAQAWLAEHPISSG